MPEAFSMTAVLVVFYTVFVGQILLISVYYPAKLIARIRYVGDNFPPAEYPLLYPPGYSGFAGPQGGRKLKFYRVANSVIALVGFMALAAAAASGYRPAEKGGDEIFVMIYFFLQIIPWVYAGLKEYEQFRLMRVAFDGRTRKAELRPRYLFDFISPVYVVAAIILYFAWLIFYMSGDDVIFPYKWEIYATLAGVTGINLIYAFVIARYVGGRKLDPHQAYKDQLKQIELLTKILVFSSIGASVFHIMTIAADRYSFEVFDPALSSFYMQLCIVIAMGLTFKTVRVEAIDYDVYKKDAPAT